MRRRQKEGGFPSLSAYIRTKLGFDATGGVDPITEYEEVDTVQIIKQLIELRDRWDGANSVLKQIARAQGLRVEALDEPRKYTRVAVEAVAENGHMDIPADDRQHSAVVPTGFSTVVEL